MITIADLFFGAGVKQIGNAVPRNLARALCLAALSQQSDVAEILKGSDNG